MNKRKAPSEKSKPQKRWLVYIPLHMKVPTKVAAMSADEAIGEFVMKAISARVRKMGATK